MREQRNEPGTLDGDVDDDSVDATCSTPPRAADRGRTVDQRQERLLIETDRHRIRGAVTLSRDGFRSRISDMLNAAERDFIALTDVTIEPLDGGAKMSCEFLALARDEDRLRDAARRLARARGPQPCGCSRRS